MESKFCFQLTQKADADLDAIVSYIALELSNSKAAADFVSKLQEVIEEVRVFPESGSLVVNEFMLNKEVRRKLVGNYIMYYLPDFSEKTIYILRIIYSSRNIDEILRQLDI